MVILIMGASHTGKTVLAQKLLEKYKYPYLSIDHLKMGLIRSGNTTLTPLDDDKLVGYLWPIVREIIKTAIENKQNLIIEGCYFPHEWQNDLTDDYLAHVKYLYLVMSKRYIEANFKEITSHANDIENRLCDDVNIEDLISDNERILKSCIENNLNYKLIDTVYDVSVETI